MSNIQPKYKPFNKNIKFVQLKRQQFIDIKKLFKIERVSELSDDTQSVFKTNNGKMVIAKRIKGRKISNFNCEFLYFISKDIIDWGETSQN